MNDLRFAAIGAGFWAGYQVAAWREVPGARCVAACDPARDKAEALAAKLGVANAYDDPRAMLDRERPDFVDIIAAPEAHEPLVLLAAERGVPAICQKPLAPTLEAARRMAEACERAGVPLLVHENWRWQAPMRALKAVLDSGAIGRPFRARLSFANSFPVFDNQPSLRTVEQFILADLGIHVLDAARFLFGEARSLSCLTAKVNPTIRGEDVATVLMDMGGAAVTVEVSYASRVEHDRFPETFAMVEGSEGSAEIAPDHWLRVTTKEATRSRRIASPRYEWANPAYDLVHASLVPCNADLLAHLRGEKTAETTAADNLKTLELVFASYESARSGRSVSR